MVVFIEMYECEKCEDDLTRTCAVLVIKTYACCDEHNFYLHLHIKFSFWLLKYAQYSKECDLDETHAIQTKSHTEYQALTCRFIAKKI